MTCISIKYDKTQYLQTEESIKTNFLNIENKKSQPNG